MSLDHENGIINVSPIRQGEVVLEVEDVGVSIRTRAYARIIITDAAKLTLDGGGLLEQDNTMDIQLFIYAFTGSLIPIEQYHLIPTELYTESYQAKEGLPISLKEGEKNTYRVLGRSIGLHRVHALARLAGTSSSGWGRKHTQGSVACLNPLQIDVFHRLIVRPPNLLLIPGIYIYIYIYRCKVHSTN